MSPKPIKNIPKIWPKPPVCVCVCMYIYIYIYKRLEASDNHTIYLSHWISKWM